MKRCLLLILFFTALASQGQTLNGFQSIFKHAVSIKINLEKGTEVGFGYTFLPRGPFVNLQAEMRWPTTSMFQMKNSVSTLGFSMFSPIRGELALGYGAHLQLRSYQTDAGQMHLFGLVGSLFPGWYWQGGKTLGGQNGSVAPGVQAYFFPVVSQKNSGEPAQGWTNGFQKKPVFRLDVGLHADYFFERTAGIGGTSMAQVVLKQPSELLPVSGYLMGKLPVTTELHAGMFYGYSRY